MQGASSEGCAVAAHSVRGASPAGLHAPKVRSSAEHPLPAAASAASAAYAYKPMLTKGQGRADRSSSNQADLWQAEPSDLPVFTLQAGNTDSMARQACADMLQNACRPGPREQIDVHPSLWLVQRAHLRLVGVRDLLGGADKVCWLSMAWAGSCMKASQSQGSCSMLPCSMPAFMHMQHRRHSAHPDTGQDLDATPGVQGQSSKWLQALACHHVTACRVPWLHHRDGTSAKQTPICATLGQQLISRCGANTGLWPRQHCKHHSGGLSTDAAMQG